jgi:hypothetical protein
MVKVTRVTFLLAKSFSAAAMSGSPTPGNAAIDGAAVAGMKNLRIWFSARIRDHLDRGSVALVRQVLAIQKN